MSLKQLGLTELKKIFLENKFSKMNDMQKKAIFQVNGPVLILAGAGSGKTTVLVNRIVNIINFANSYNEETLNEDVSSNDYEYLNEIKDSADYDINRIKKILNINTVNPWNILAITFTNKAASELKERLTTALGDCANNINAGTIHSICLKILRKEISALDFQSNFTIYDTDDSIRVIKDCLSEQKIDDKMFPPKSLLYAISRAKDSMIEPDEYIKENSDDFKKNVIGNVYKMYQQRLKSANAVDFDDIIYLTVTILKNNPDILNHYQNLFKYIMVDEYQDTNKMQFQLISLLSAKSKNLCVVGDDDQSIYKFRGATIENILSFEKQFKDAVVIRLEQNYRSTQNILDAANNIIKNNKNRKGKNLWTENDTGNKIVSYRCPDESDEAHFVSNKILENVEKGDKFSDHAILYRMNAQSANIEHQLVKCAIPYKIVGGTKFFERKEIKDILSYFHVINNEFDVTRLKRIINEPKRGIGDATVKNIQMICEQENVSMLEVMVKSDEYQATTKKSKSLKEFSSMIKEIRELTLTLSLSELLDELVEQTKYYDYLKLQGKEGEGRIENIEELKSNLIRFENENENATLEGFLEEISLYTDLDNVNSSDDKVILMTMHSAKGLEYKTVFIVGMEENIFPSYMASNSEEELEEERRLAYVAVTRAKENLYITNASQRMLFGKTSRNMPSRFLKEVPDDFIEVIDKTVKAYGYIKRPEKPKPVYKPEIEGTVGIQKTIIPASVNYKIGDSIEHSSFGNGVVKNMTKMSNDVLVEIEFKDVGTKKIMANFAKLTKI